MMSTRGIFLAIAFSVLALAELNVQDVFAFDYVEHTSVTRQALADEITASSARDDVVLAIRATLSSQEVLCSIWQDHFSKNCIGIAELTGLAGDFSVTPADLVFQILEPMDSSWWSTLTDPVKRLLSSTIRVVGGFFKDKRGEFVTVDKLKLGEIHQFLAGRAALETWSKSPCTETMADRENTLASTVNPSYLGFAASNLNHFVHASHSPAYRQPSSPIVLRGSLAKYMPWYATPEAVVTYQDMHAAAIIFGQMSTDPKLDATKRQKLRGVAWLHEVFALHFLQDMIAPGHNQAFANESYIADDLRRKSLHDQMNSGTRAVLLPEACKRLSGMRGSPVLVAALAVCDDEVHEFNAVGDYFLHCEPKVGAVTQGLAVAACRLSIRELLATLDGKSALTSAEMATVPAIGTCISGNSSLGFVDGYGQSPAAVCSATWQLWTADSINGISPKNWKAAIVDNLRSKDLFAALSIHRAIWFGPRW